MKHGSEIITITEELYALHKNDSLCISCFFGNLFSFYTSFRSILVPEFEQELLYKFCSAYQKQVGTYWRLLQEKYYTGCGSDC